MTRSVFKKARSFLSVAVLSAGMVAGVSASASAFMTTTVVLKNNTTTAKTITSASAYQLISPGPAGRVVAAKGSDYFTVTGGPNLFSVHMKAGPCTFGYTAAINPATLKSTITKIADPSSKCSVSSTSSITFTILKD